MNGGQASILGAVRVNMHFTRDQLLLLFAAANLGFLSLDVAIAHSVNGFVPVYEWIPVFLPPVGAITAGWLGLSRQPSAGLKVAHVLTMLASLLVGLLGLAFHLKAMIAPGGAISWNWIVFSAPVIAPLSFAGVGLVGLFGIVDESPQNPGVLSLMNAVTVKAPLSKTQHLLLFVGLGFAGAAATSFLDHAQYGYRVYEWIPIILGIFATIVVLGRAFVRRSSRVDDLIYLWTMIAAILVGVLGFAFHLSHDLADSGALSLERMRAFAPIFAPFLFSDLGILGLLVVVETSEDPPEVPAIH
ncbi:MAG TPA: hypothetical protein VMV81_13515 [Phycisphaerae bacterium]|nr:hypothetical protein [Phycisphaerae bacterium]